MIAALEDLAVVIVRRRGRCRSLAMMPAVMAALFLMADRVVVMAAMVALGETCAQAGCVVTEAGWKQRIGNKPGEGACRGEYGARAFNA
jgi:hypothetical protein